MVIDTIGSGGFWGSRNEKGSVHEKRIRLGADWTMTMVTDITVSGMTFGGDWMATYEEFVQQRRVILADEVEYY